MSAVSLLLVDDRPENLLALEAILKDTGHTLVRATSGAEALKAVLRQEFALILMDVAMPDIDGYETVELIRGRERSRHTPIIFLTANIKSDAHVFRGYAVGAVDYLFKPFSAEVLLSKVAVFVELFSKRQAIKASADALKRAYDEMERRVEDRTSELAETNRSLKAEMAKRQRMEIERAKLLEREQGARLEAQAMNRLKDEFLATLSHELRTPLNAILGWTHMLEVGPKDDKAIARATRVIKNNALAQAQLVADILDVSTIINGKLNLHLELVSLKTVIEAALEAIQPAADAKAITIENVAAEGPGVVADRDRLQQIMWNLVSNAVKFTPKGGRVRIEMETLDDEVRVIVSDSGQGIDPGFLPHVFERFTQADSSISRAHGGLGLGMAIVRHLVELHGGSVTAASAGRDMGATFTVVLPFSARTTEEAMSKVERRAAERKTARTKLPMLHGIGVLVLDDEADAREVLKVILESQGASVVAVDAADEALRVIRADPPHVIVSDIAMPGEDGLTFMRRLRTLEPNQGGHTPSIALSVYASDQDAAAAMAAGFDRHFAKPVQPAELIEAVAALATPERMHNTRG